MLDPSVMEVPSAAGDLITRMFAAFAQFERDQLMERTHANIARAKAVGKISGRMLSLTATQRPEIGVKLATGATAPYSPCCCITARAAKSCVCSK